MKYLRNGLTAQIPRLLCPYWPIVLGGVVLGLVGGGSVAGLLAVVNQGLYATQADVATLVIAFTALCLLILVGSIGADISVLGSGSLPAFAARLPQKFWLLRSTRSRFTGRTG